MGSVTNASAKGTNRPRQRFSHHAKGRPTSPSKTVVIPASLIVSQSDCHKAGESNQVPMTGATTMAEAGGSEAADQGRL